MDGKHVLSRRNFLQIGSGTLAGWILSGCSQPTVAIGNDSAEDASASVQLISAETLAADLSDKSFTLINVHYPYSGEIPQTDHLIPYDAILDNPNLPDDRGAPIVLYCESGPMSAAAAKTLLAAGYTNIRDLRGGLRAWDRAGQQRVYNQ